MDLVRRERGEPWKEGADQKLREAESVRLQTKAARGGENQAERGPDRSRRGGAHDVVLDWTTAAAFH